MPQCLTSTSNRVGIVGGQFEVSYPALWGEKWCELVLKPRTASVCWGKDRIRVEEVGRAMEEIRLERQRFRFHSKGLQDRADCFEHDGRLYQKLGASRRVSIPSEHLKDAELDGGVKKDDACNDLVLIGPDEIHDFLNGGCKNTEVNTDFPVLLPHQGNQPTLHEALAAHPFPKGSTILRFFSARWSGRRAEGDLNRDSTSIWGHLKKLDVGVDVEHDVFLVRRGTLVLAALLLNDCRKLGLLPLVQQVVADKLDAGSERCAVKSIMV